MSCLPYTVVSTHKQCFHHKLGLKPVINTNSVFPQNPRLGGSHMGPSPQHESRPPREQLLLQPLTAEGPRGPALSLEKPPPCDCWELIAVLVLVVGIMYIHTFFFSLCNARNAPQSLCFQSRQVVSTEPLTSTPPFLLQRYSIPPSVS